MTCETTKGQHIQSEEDWRKEHAPHGEPSKSYPEPQPTSYRLAHHKCPCGAVIVTVEMEPCERAKIEALAAEADYWEGEIK